MLYLRVVRSEPLRRAHVTLALRDLTPKRLTTVRADLEGRARSVRTRLETVDVVHVVFPRHVYLGRFALAEGGAAR